jgi:hypothetical protein
MFQDEEKIKYVRPWQQRQTGDANNIGTKAGMLDPFSRAWSVLAIACTQ